MGIAGSMVKVKSIDDHSISKSVVDGSVAGLVKRVYIIELIKEIDKSWVFEIPGSCLMGNHFFPPGRNVKIENI